MSVTGLELNDQRPSQLTDEKRFEGVRAVAEIDLAMLSVRGYSKNLINLSRLAEVADKVYEVRDPGYVAVAEHAKLRFRMNSPSGFCLFHA